MTVAFSEGDPLPSNNDYPSLQTVTDPVVGTNELDTLIPTQRVNVNRRQHMGDIIRTNTSFHAVIDPEAFPGQESIDEIWTDTYKRMARLSIEAVRAIAEGRVGLVH